MKADISYRIVSESTVIFGAGPVSSAGSTQLAANAFSHGMPASGAESADRLLDLIANT